MYDAALADVSDRNFYIGSIFHDVIYIPSFLSDPSDDKRSDITSLTEQYVCRFLLPEDYHEEGCNLKNFNVYLKKEIFTNADSESDFRKREKIIYTLQNFITYLAYRSNGAPKKITRFFEYYIREANLSHVM